MPPIIERKKVKAIHLFWDKIKRRTKFGSAEFTIARNKLFESIQFRIKEVPIKEAYLTSVKERSKFVYLDIEIKDTIKTSLTKGIIRLKNV